MLYLTTCFVFSCGICRLEVYCGKGQTAAEVGDSADPNAGPAAVLRNLNAVLPTSKPGVYHVVVTDRFYTSVQLAYQLLYRRVYSIGTIEMKRVGFPNLLRPPATGNKTKKQSSRRPAHVARGSTTIAVANNCPRMTLSRWWDNKAVYVLATGASTKMETCGECHVVLVKLKHYTNTISVERRVPGGQRVTLPCPAPVRDYQRWMGGVEIHDQLRLQRYSLQLQVRVQKYYKAIFFGLVDMACVNAYIVAREAKKQRGESPADHSQFLLDLQAQLLEITAADFDERVSQHVVCGIMYQI